MIIAETAKLYLTRLCKDVQTKHFFNFYLSTLSLVIYVNIIPILMFSLNHNFWVYIIMKNEL